MANSSTSPALCVSWTPPQLSYDRCCQTLAFCKNIRLQITKDTPLYRCLHLIWNGQLDIASFPPYSIHASQIPVLTHGCKVALWHRLTAAIPLGNSVVTPLNWLCKLVSLSEGQDWDYWDTILTGSALPMTSDYWKLYLKAVGDFDLHLNDAFVSTLASLGKDWRNLDALIRVQLGPSPDSRKLFESAVMQALYFWVESEMTTRELYFAVTGPTPIGNHGTIFTIGNTTRSFDLMVWYPPENYGLPELFTQQGLCLPIHHLLGRKIQHWPDIIATPVGVSPSLLPLDRCLNIVRFHPSHSIGLDTNFGIFKKLMVMKAKGGLGAQNGLEEWALRIYLQNRQDPKTASYDAQQSYQEHLPQSLGTHLSHWLHWMAAMNGAENIKARKALATGLECPAIEAAPKHLQQTFSFLKRYPHRFPRLLMALEFVMLLDYIKNPDKNVSCGLWDGRLTLNLPLDATSGTYFQSFLHPLKTCRRLFLFLKNERVNQEIKTDVIRLIRAYLENFEIHEGFSPHPESLGLIEKMGFEETYLQEIGLLLYELPAPAATSEMERIGSPQTEESEDEESLPSFSPCIYKPVPSSRPATIQELVENNEWGKLQERLIKASKRQIPDEKLPKFGDALWSLFGAWSLHWQHVFPSKAEQKSMLQLLSHYSKALQQTGNEQRSGVLRNLLMHGFKAKRQLNILWKIQENHPGLLMQDHVQELLNPMITSCYDCALLLQIDRLAPNYARNFVLDQLSMRPLPPPEKLSELIRFLRDVDNEQLDTLDFPLVKQLCLELRDSEIKCCDLTTDPAAFMESLFMEFLQNGDFEKAWKILAGLSRHTSTEFISKELDLIQAETLAAPQFRTLKRALELLKSSKTEQRINPVRILFICVELVTQDLNIDAPTMKELWMELKNEYALKALSPPRWRALLSNIQKSTNYGDLWEAFDLMLDTTTPWNPSIEKIFVGLLKKSLKTLSKKTACEVGKNQLLPVLSKLEDRIRWEEKMEHPNGITFLALRNLTAIAKNHPLKNDRYIVRDVARSIINAVRIFPISQRDMKILRLAQIELYKGCPCPGSASQNLEARLSRWNPSSPLLYKLYWAIFIFSILLAIYLQIKEWTTLEEEDHELEPITPPIEPHKILGYFIRTITDAGIFECRYTVEGRVCGFLDDEGHLYEDLIE